MDSPPSETSSKRKHVGKASESGLKRIKSYLRPPSPNRKGSRSSSRSAGSVSRSRSPVPYSSKSTVAHSISTQGLIHEIHTVPGKLPALDPNPTPLPAATGTKKGAVDKLQDAVTSGLESALRALHISADIIPPLKPAIDAFVDCLDIIQAVTKNDKEYDELTAELTTMAHTIQEYLAELSPDDHSSRTSCARIAASIQVEVAQITKKRGLNKGRRALEATDDSADVIQHYRKIEGLFRQLQSDIGLQTLKSIKKQNMTTLLRGMSPVDDARYNSSYSETIERRGCTEETRKQVQAELQNWVQDTNGAKVYWMNGMAGTGKTTIAYTLCKWLQVKRQLGASFFCSRNSPLCRNVNSIVPTIAYQLAQYSQPFRAALIRILENEPEVSRLGLVPQFERLFRDPMQEAASAMPSGAVVVIDALDECEDDVGVRRILQMLLKLGPSIPLKFFVAGRPEPSIRGNMLSLGGYSPSVLHLHDIEQSVVEGDIRNYLAESLSQMFPRPTDEQIDQLAKLSGKLFIYAATVTRYILPGKAAVNSINRLNSVLAAGSLVTSNKESVKKYKQLDDLYSNILSMALNEEELEEGEIEAIQVVLWTAICAKAPMTIPTLASILSLSEHEVLSALQPLRSVLHVSERSELVSALHASFPDYMLDYSRSGEFCCNHVQHNGFLAQGCFQVMKSQLQFNMCNLESSCVLDSEILDLDQRIKDAISSTLLYACSFWGDHLRQAGSESLDVLHQEVVDLLTDRLLFWMEVLSLQRCVVKGISALSQAEEWLLDTNAPMSTRQFVADAKEFIVRFAAGACSRSTPHIYISALPFCAKSSSVYKHYWARTRGLIDVRGTAINDRSNAAQATWMTNQSITSLGISADGAYIVSGSLCGMVSVRDARTGDLIVGSFEAHRGSIHSVAFSPDGTCIVSGSYDRCIRIWNAHTGDIVTGPFKGHRNQVNCVAFSPDGTKIVSGSQGRTIRVWDTCTGNTVAGPFLGHKSSVNAVTFSPDGTKIVSGSRDRTLRIWSAQTGDATAPPFKGHASSVNSVAFSPNGMRITSGSYGGGIRVWNPATGIVTAGPFKGHKASVNSVAFSPDSTRIVSGSSDSTVRVWDAQTGDNVAGPFQGHKFEVYSVLFSRDGTRIFSSSNDKTIRVWNAHAANDGAEPLHEHITQVTAVAFSPDGTHIASAHDDRSISVWDARTGDAVTGRLHGHSETINSVAFSPDGRFIASGSHDKTIRLWDARTGGAIAGPFEGHTTGVNMVAFSSDGTHIVSGSYNQNILIWDVRSGLVVARPLQKFIPKLNSITFSPNGSSTISGSGDRSIRIQGAGIGGVTTRLFEQHGDTITSVAFTSDGTKVVSGCQDFIIRVQDARSSNIIVKFQQGHTRMINSVAFSPDDRRIVSGSKDSVIRVWDILFSGEEFQPTDEGWFKNVHGLLFWVSPDFHSYVPHPRNTLLIGSRGTSFIDYHSLLIGSRWSECYLC